MNVYYIKLKNGEELISQIDDDQFSSEDSGEFLLINNAIVLTIDAETGTTSAKYWITHSDHKEVNLSLDDAYFVGLANEQAINFFQKFIKLTSHVEEEEEISDEEYEDIFNERLKGYTIH